MTALPARCRKTNDAPRVPTSTILRVRRSRAEWACVGLEGFGADGLGLLRFPASGSRSGAVHRAAPAAGGTPGCGTRRQRRSAADSRNGHFGYRNRHLGGHRGGNRRSRSRQSRHLHRSRELPDELTAGQGRLLGNNLRQVLAAHRRRAVRSPKQRFRPRVGRCLRATGERLHPNRDLRGEHRRLRGQRGAFFGQFGVQWRRRDAVGRFGRADDHPAAARVLDQVSGVPGWDHPLLAGGFGKSGGGFRLAHITFQRFLLLLQHAGLLAGVAELVRTLRGGGG